MLSLLVGKFRSGVRLRTVFVFPVVTETRRESLALSSLSSLISPYNPLNLKLSLILCFQSLEMKQGSATMKGVRVASFLLTRSRSLRVEASSFRLLFKQMSFTFVFLSRALSLLPIGVKQT